jgi:hypothetical protein
VRQAPATPRGGPDGPTRCERAQHRGPGCAPRRDRAGAGEAQTRVSMEQPKTMETAVDPRWYITLGEAGTFPANAPSRVRLGRVPAPGPVACRPGVVPAAARADAAPEGGHAAPRRIAGGARSTEPG